jgi:hypothetical protein
VSRKEPQDPPAYALKPSWTVLTGEALTLTGLHTYIHILTGLRLVLQRRLRGTGTLCLMPYALCLMPYAVTSMPATAPPRYRRLSYALRVMRPYALRLMPYDL